MMDGSHDSYSIEITETRKMTSQEFLLVNKLLVLLYGYLYLLIPVVTEYKSERVHLSRYQ